MSRLEQQLAEHRGSLMHLDDTMHLFDPNLLRPATAGTWRDDLDRNLVGYTQAEMLAFTAGLKAASNACRELQKTAVNIDAEHMAAIAAAKILGMADVLDLRAGTKRPL